MGVTLLDLDIKAIPFTEFMAVMGKQPIKRDGSFLVYNAPYADNRPTMVVDMKMNRWHDAQDCSHGDIYSLAAKIIGSYDKSEINWFIASEMSKVREIRITRGSPIAGKPQRKQESGQSQKARQEPKVKRKSIFRL